MSKANSTRSAPKLVAVPTPDQVLDTATEVERAAYRAAASVAVLWHLLLNSESDDGLVRIPAAILADFMEGIDCELNFVTAHIGSMKMVSALSGVSRD